MSLVRNIWALLLLCGGCAPAPPAQPFERLSAEEMRDPVTCAACHPQHYAQWSGSMHAYASTDPIFRAMIRRAARDTAGQVGRGCVTCHAPLALELELTQDGSNLTEVPAWAQGVTCYHCHRITQVEGEHLPQASVHSEPIMHGPIDHPLGTAAHASKYSALHDRDQPESSGMCGTCHPASLGEWRASVYATGDLGAALTCGSCHMTGRDDVAATVDHAPTRRAHRHTFAAVDVALTDFPQRAEQKAEVQEQLDTAMSAKLCVTANTVLVGLENLAAGHEFPSCAPHDRRLWLELVAWDEAGDVLFQTGVAADGEPVATLGDPNLWLMRDRLTDSAGEEVTMVWTATAHESVVLPPQTPLDPMDPEFIDPHVTRTFTLPGEPARVQMRVRLRPIGLEIVDDLIDSGDLDPKHRDALPTWTLGSTVLEWNQGDILSCVP